MPRTGIDLGPMQVFVTGLDVYAFHGVPDAEREVGHRYRADLTLEVDEDASATDQIDGT
ncbi:MAG: dihydroneopterin aldolase, partial [Fimbriimonas sp.]